jgi:SAM-dependent MidA family methyltransferase
VTRSLQSGAAWFIDYGYDNGGYYGPQRRAGTLRCHYRHRAHDDALFWPGLQDITAWVDFDVLIAAGAAQGFHVEPIVTQTQFLIGNGLDEVFAAAYGSAGDEPARYRLAQEVKRLVQPDQMGDAFKVVTLRR